MRAGDGVAPGGMSRRGALAALGAGAIGLAAGGPARSAARPILRTWPVGVQLWSVNAELRKDVPGTLRRLKAGGYDVVETAGLAGLSAAAFRRILDDAGLVCPSAHVSMGDLLAGLDQKIEDARALGARWLVCASPRPLTPIVPTGDWGADMKRAMTLDAWKANADDLARIAPVVAKAGLTLAYHNHFMEFADLGGITGYDLIARAAAPSLLRLEMDLGWVFVGGADPLAVLARHADRIDMLHVKDFARDPGQRLGWRCVDLGEGAIDLPPILKEARKQRVKYIYVEQEAPYVRPVFDSLATARTYLTRL
jgi:sugar phosphate isomerase/epimerase